MSKVLPFVSVIVPVYNDTKQLETCLDALENQTYPKESYEIIIIDNNSEEDVVAVTNQFSQARVTHEKRRGSYAARNKGLSVAKGIILGFTDSDCTPASNWIEKGVEKLLQDPQCGFVAGKIKLSFKNPSKPTVVELYDSVNFLRQEYYVRELNFGATANMFTYKKVFDDVGLFNADLKSSGDREWGQRVFKHGYPQIYAEDVCIAHPARNRLKELRNKVSRIVEGLYFLDNKKPKSTLGFLKELYLDLKPPRKEILDLLNSKKMTSLSIKSKYILLFMILRWTGALTKLKLYRKMNHYKVNI